MKIEIIGKGEAKLKGAGNKTIISYKLSSRPDYTWHKIFDIVYAQEFHSQKTGSRIVDSLIEVEYIDGMNLKIMQDFIIRVVQNANKECERFLQEKTAEQERQKNLQRQQENALKKLNDELRKLD